MWIPQPEARGSSIFTLSFKTICSSDLIPACKLRENNTNKGSTQPGVSPVTWTFVLENAEISSWLFSHLFWGFVRPKINEHGKKGWSSKFFGSFQKSLQAPKILDVWLEPWLLISPEPPNPVRLFFSSVLIIKDWFVVMEKCPKRRPAAFRSRGVRKKRKHQPPCRCNRLSGPAWHMSDKIKKKNPQQCL